MEETRLRGDRNEVYTPMPGIDHTGWPTSPHTVLPTITGPVDEGPGTCVIFLSG